MKKIKIFVKKLLRTFLTIIILWSGIYAYTVFQGHQNWQSPMEICTNLSDFYTNTSWYNTKREYIKDMEFLQEVKQSILDSLTYKETVLIMKWETIDNNKLNFIEDLIKLNLELQKKVDKPEYLTIDANIKQDIKSQNIEELDFIKLLK